MSRQRRKTRGQKKGKRKTITGLDRPFFLGRDSKLAGFMHYKPPRWTEEYAKMDDRDLYRRIQDDLEELLARAYPTYSKESKQRFAPNYLRKFPHSYEGYLRCVINKSVAEELCHGLWERITSQDKTVSGRAREEYQRLLPRFLESEPRHAAKALAFIAISLTTYLENLFVKRQALMRKVAAKYDLWPVNLGLRSKIIKGDRKHQLRRLTFARNYLTQLGLNSDCDFPTAQESGAEPMSPFKLAAQDLYVFMLLEKDSKLKWNELNAWEKKLRALHAPMTRKRALDWWKVAKIYVDERWETARSEFTPLIKHLGLKLSNKTPYESSIKSRVIDNDLKDAFIGLAQPDL